MSIARGAAGAMLILLGGCGWEVMPMMRTGSSLGQSARAPVALPEGSVPRGAGQARTALAGPGPALDAQLLKRGADGYRTYCTPCHGNDARVGGPVVQQGYPRPPSLVDAPDAPSAERLVEIISNGVGIMYGFEGRIAPADRWAIAQHVRALQAGQAGQQP